MHAERMCLLEILEMQRLCRTTGSVTLAVDSVLTWFAKQRKVHSNAKGHVYGVQQPTCHASKAVCAADAARILTFSAVTKPTAFMGRLAFSASSPSSSVPSPAAKWCH